MSTQEKKGLSYPQKSLKTEWTALGDSKCSEKRGPKGRLTSNVRDGVQWVILCGGSLRDLRVFVAVSI